MKYDSDEDIERCLKTWGCELITKLSNIAWSFVYCKRSYSYIIRNLHEANHALNAVEKEIWYGKSN